MGSSTSDFYSKYIEKLQARAEEAVKDAQKKAFAEYFEVADKKIHDIYKDTITDFYNSYDRTFYKPRNGGSLYQLLETEIEDDGLSLDFNPSKISYRNGYAGEDGLYDQVFRQGWHGGANINGQMLVPWTHPPIAYNGDKSPWEPSVLRSEEIKSGWKLAEKAPISPLNDFKQRLDKYQQKEYQQDYEKIWNKYKTNITIDMS